MMGGGLHGQRRAARGQLAVDTTHRDTSSAVMCASGILDARTAPALVCVVEGHLLRGRRFLRLNVSRLRIGDAEGVGAVVEAHRRVLAARGTLILTGVPETMRVVIGAA